MLANLNFVQQNGWLNIYKEKNYTSTDVIRILKKKFSISKIGHYGTLDPLATGVLPVALGEATKTIKYITYNEKKYSFIIKWGEETDTCDEEGKVLKKSVNRPKVEEIEFNIKKYFRGKIFQKPPLYSAVKINGKRAYELARKQIKFETNFKEINIYKFKIKKVLDDNNCKFEIYCSPGTYIRSLARDLAHKLGTYGFATDIVRNKNSFFLSDNAIFINKILNTNKDNLIKLVLPVDYALKNYTQINVEKKYSKMIKDGRIISLENLKKVNNTNSLILIKCENRLVSIANLEKGYIIPRRNFNN